MSTLEDAIYALDTNRAVEILSSNHDLPQSELDSVLAIAISSEGPDSAVEPLLSHGAQITNWSFCGAAARGDVTAFQAFLDHGWDTNSLDFGQPALRLAIENQEVVQWFLDHGADPNLKGTIDASVLATAALRPSTSILELLISHGAKLGPMALFRTVNPWGKGGIPITKYLIDRGIDINAIGSMMGSPEGTPLHYAVKLESKEKVEVLLGAEADRTIGNIYGITASKMAKEKGFMEIFNLLST